MSIKKVSVTVLSLGIFLSSFNLVVAKSEVSNEKSRGKGQEMSLKSPEGSPRGKVRSCEAHKEAITKRSERMLDRSENLLAKMDAVVVRTKEFYTKNSLNLSNYATLTSEIDSKKSAVTTSLNAASAALSAFNCNSENPKEQLSKYKTEMMNVVKNLNDYKKSVRNFVAEVRSKGKANK